MITLTTGANAITFPRQDFPNPLPAVIVCRLVHSTTNIEHWCELADDGALVDWVKFPIMVLAANANPAESEVALGVATTAASDYDIFIYGGAAYVENPNVLDLIIKNRCRYGL